jgi:hypothetical protein
VNIRVSLIKSFNPLPLKACFIRCVFLLLVAISNGHTQSFLALSTITNPPDFSRLSYAEADSAVRVDAENISSGWKFSSEYLTNLLYQFQQGKLSNRKKVLCAWLIGELRPNDTNSIECLIENISLEATNFDDVRLGLIRWGNYPVQEALGKIGKPAVNPIFEHLRIETDNRRRNLMCRVLELTEDGKSIAENSEIAKGQLQGKIAAETDPIIKANLEAALEEIEKGR